jgi:hypothetical protein
LVTQKDMENVFAPIFQKAIDITKELLKRNNLKGSDLGCIDFGWWSDLFANPSQNAQRANHRQS